MTYTKEIIEFHRYAPGCPEDPALAELLQRYIDFASNVEPDPTKHSGGPNRIKVDLAWLVLMHRSGILETPAAAALLRAAQALQLGEA